VPEGAWISQKATPLSTSAAKSTAQSTHIPDPIQYARSDMAFQGKSSWSAEKETILQGPYEYLFAQPGKDIRSQLIAAFNQWLEVPHESLEIITKVVGMLHTASLLVDDPQHLWYSTNHQLGQLCLLLRLERAAET
jgi:geranylgeranyl diphosphate synthase type 3